VDAFLTSRNVSDVLVGLHFGVVIGLVALSLVMIWRATHILNFAQGAMAMFSAYVGMSLLSYNVGYWWCVVVAVIAGLAIGGITERVLVRRLYGKPEINPIVVMVGFLALLEAVASAVWGMSGRAVPLPFSFVDWQLNGQTIAISPNGLYQIVAALVVAILVVVLFRYTNLGLQLRAAAVAPEVSRLLGVRVSRMLTLGWILSSGVGAVAAVIVASNFGPGLTPTLMDAPFAIAFIAAAVGGLESPWGALVAGVAFGIMQQFVIDYLNSDYVFLIALGALVVVLMMRPQGLFTKSVSRRV
jgi:branched-chain amino acid transport system permease protein